MKDDFYQVELNKTTWDIPKRYGNLSPVGSGAYGQVKTIYLVTQRKNLVDSASTFIGSNGYAKH